MALKIKMQPDNTYSARHLLKCVAMH